MFFWDEHQKPHQTCSNISTLPETNMFASKNGCLEDDPFGEFGLFSGAKLAVSFRGVSSVGSKINWVVATQIFVSVHLEPWGRGTQFDEHIFFRWVG